METRELVWMLSSLVMVGAMGCGDDDGRARPPYRAEVDVDVSEDTPISSLDGDARERVCRSYDAYLETYVSFEAIGYVACLLPAIVFGGGEDGCERLLDECTSALPDPIEISASVRDVEVCIDALGDCSSSIVDLEGCVNLDLDQALDIVDNWSCRGLDDDRIAEAARAMDTVSVCASIDDACADAVAFGPD